MTSGPDPEPEAPLPAPPEHLWGVYLLGTLSLAGTGAGAGQLFHQFARPRAADGVLRCLINNGIDPRTLTGGLDAYGGDPVVVAGCVRELGSVLGAAALAGAAAVLVAAWVLVVVDGWRIRAALDRRGAVGYRSPALTRVEERFEHWCDRAALTGRRRPRLVLGAPGGLAGQARTTAVPFARPVVVIPAAYAYADPAQVDLAVLHELAHVRARDLSWASATWWAGWLQLPVLAVALSPIALHPGAIPAGRWAQIWLALALTAAILVLRAGLLRQRERAADAYAVAALGDAGVLAALSRPVAVPPSRAVGVPPSAPGRLPAAVRGLLRVHPPAARRVREAAEPTDRWRAGFALAAATGLVAMFTAQLIATVARQYLALDPARGWWFADLSLVGGSLLWALVVVPAWSRAGRPANGRWAAVLGSAVGLGAGYFLPAPGTVDVSMLDLYQGHAVTAVGWFLVAALGTAALAAGLATGLPRAAAVPAGLVAGLVTACGLAVALHTVELAVVHDSPGKTRAFLLHRGDTGWTGWTAWAVVPAVAALLLLFPAATTAAGDTTVGDTTAGGGRGRSSGAGVGRWERVMPAGVRSVVLVAALVGAALAVVTAQWRIAGTGTQDASYVLLTERLWLAGAVGAVAAAVVLLAVRGATVPHALVAGAVVTAAVGLAQALRDAVGDPAGRDAETFVLFLRTPLWLYLVGLVAILPALWALRSAPPIALGRWRLGSRGGPGLRAGVAAAAGAAAVTSLVMGGAAGGVTAVRGDLAAALVTVPPAPTWVTVPPAPSSVTVPPAPTRAALAVPTPPPSPERPAAPQPQRVLNQAQADAMLRRIRLPAGWAAVKNAPDVDDAVRPASCARLFAAVRATDEARPASARAKRTFELPKSRLPPVGASVVVNLISYRDAEIAHQAAQDAPRQEARCRRWTMPLDSGTEVAYSWRPGGRLDLAYPSLAQWLQARADFSGVPFVSASAIGQVRVGNNLVSVSVVDSYGAKALPRERAARLAHLRQSILSDLVAALGRH